MEDFDQIKTLANFLDPLFSVNFNLSFFDYFMSIAIFFKLKVVQQHGMQALRDNPELMGTSVGMLRRAAGVLQQLSKVAACRPKFAKHQQRLLQFTMSQLMDSRSVFLDIFFLFLTYLRKGGLVLSGFLS